MCQADTAGMGKAKMEPGDESQKNKGDGENQQLGGIRSRLAGGLDRGRQAARQGIERSTEIASESAKRADEVLTKSAERAGLTDNWTRHAKLHAAPAKS